MEGSVQEGLHGIFGTCICMHFCGSWPYHSLLLSPPFLNFILLSNKALSQNSQGKRLLPFFSLHCREEGDLLSKTFSVSPSLKGRRRALLEP